MSANLNMNKIILGGRLTKEPELRKTNNGTSVCPFTIAVNKKKREDGADFIDCVAWRQAAESIAQYFHKGSCIAVVGSLGSRKYNDRDGQQRVAWEVTVDEFYFVDSKGERPSPQSANADSSPSPQAGEGAFEELSSDDDLPF